MLAKNTSGQGLYLYAVDTGASPVAGKTGDASNITGHYSLDGAAAGTFGTAHPTEIGGGVYWQPLAQAETNGDQAAYYWASSTSGVVIDPVFESTGPPSFNSLTIDGSGHVTSGTVSDKTGYALSSSGVASILPETGIDLRQAIGLILAMCAGKCSGLPSSPVTFRNANDTANRVVIGFDSNNNRTSVTLTLP